MPIGLLQQMENLTSPLKQQITWHRRWKLLEERKFHQKCIPSPDTENSKNPIEPKKLGGMLP